MIVWNHASFCLKCKFYFENFMAMLILKYNCCERRQIGGGHPAAGARPWCWAQRPERRETRVRPLPPRGPRAMPASAARRPASERAPGGPRQAALQGAARRPAPSDLSGGCDTLAQVFAHWPCRRPWCASFTSFPTAFSVVQRASPSCVLLQPQSAGSRSHLPHCHSQKQRMRKMTHDPASHLSVGRFQKLLTKFLAAPDNWAPAARSTALMVTLLLSVSCCVCFFPHYFHSFFVCLAEHTVSDTYVANTFFHSVTCQVSPLMVIFEDIHYIIYYVY